MSILYLRSSPERQERKVPLHEHKKFTNQFGKLNSSRKHTSILDFVDVKLDKLPRRKSILDESTLDHLKKYGKVSKDEKANKIDKFR